MMGSPPMPMAVDWPSPARVSWSTASYVSVPERETTPTLPGSKIIVGMMPTLTDAPGVSRPGQLGPTRRTPFLSTYGLTGIMSWTGIPSVMQTTVSTPASAASRMASAANGGGTKMTETLAPSFSTASATVL